MGKFRLAVAAAIVAVVGIAAWVGSADAYTCYSYRSGNQVVTNCN